MASALVLALLRAGNNSAARIAIIAITTRSSIRVNAVYDRREEGSSASARRQRLPGNGLRRCCFSRSCRALVVIRLLGLGWQIIWLKSARLASVHGCPQQTDREPSPARSASE